MVEKNQKMRYNKQELAVIAGALDEDIIYALRKHLLQLELLEQEWVMLKKAVSPELVKVLKKEFVGGIEYETPLMMTHDPFVFKETTTLDPEGVYNMSEGKMLVVDYFGKQLDELETDVKNDIRLENMKPKVGEDQFERYIHLYARSVIISVTDIALNDFLTLSNKPVEESDEDKRKRKLKDSSK